MGYSTAMFLLVTNSRPISNPYFKLWVYTHIRMYIHTYIHTCPLLFSGLRAALCCSRTLTTTSCPLLQATCSGVQPKLFTASIYR